jgi:hypothetical protein
MKTLRELYAKENATDAKADTKDEKTLPIPKFFFKVCAALFLPAHSCALIY